MQTRLSYMLVGLITLLVVALAFYALAPWNIR
jgi:ABC-type transporter Mla subunit MlaD